jgi:hypothetical protein
MDPSQGTLEWTIGTATNERPLYRGVGGHVTTELNSLYTTYGNGSYLISFVYTTEDGMRVEKTRLIFIDTGVVTENQYE